MEYPGANNKSIRTKVIIGTCGVVALLLLIAVGYLIVKISQNQPQEVVYTSNSSQQDSGNGLALGTADTGANNGTNSVNLQGLTNSSPNSSAGTQSPQALPAPSSSTPLPKPVRSQTLPNGLKIDEYVYGTGERATKAGDTIAVHYIGYLTTGQAFDTSLQGDKKPFAFILGSGKVIPGWDIGLQDMRVGSVRRLTIPPALAYGAKGSPPAIGPNATLVFDVQLMGIQQ